MPGNLASAFRQLDKALTDSQHLWRPQPFTDENVPWGQTHPHLHAALLGLDETRAAQLHDDPQQRLNWFRQWERDLCDALYAFEPPPASVNTRLAPDSECTHVPGRKWQQIRSFTAALAPIHLPHVDWCAGKGHLGRIVSRSQQQPVHCLEWDPALIALGAALAKKQQRDLHYHHQDVTKALPLECSDPEMVHIGLHVCGELHHHLLQHVADTRAASVALAPCCYHKIAAQQYRPLSAAARNSLLSLNRSELHIAVQDTVTAGRGERRWRELERGWRLAFDALQRDLRGVDEYLNLPSSNRALLQRGFPAFCDWAAYSRQLTLPREIDYDHYLSVGKARQRGNVRLELLRQLFNRPLELWLVLDCALYLEEQGYTVSIARFCQREVSPRNVLIQGQRATGHALHP